MSNKQTSKGVTVSKADKVAKAPTAITEVKEQITAIIETPIPTTIAELWALIDKRLTAIESSPSVVRSKGLMSTRGMSEDDAKRIMTGDLASKSITECAKELGLSYGQIYSARNGYTFKSLYAAKVKADATPAKK
jgi:hypothetical protein